MKRGSGIVGKGGGSALQLFLQSSLFIGHSCTCSWFFISMLGKQRRQIVDTENTKINHKIWFSILSVVSCAGYNLVSLQKTNNTQKMQKES